MMDPNRALDDLLRKIHSRRVQMTAIRCDGSSDEQTPVPPVELNDLTFRFIPENAVAPVGLWSRFAVTPLRRADPSQAIERHKEATTRFTVPAY